MSESKLEKLLPQKAGLDPLPPEREERLARIWNLKIRGGTPSAIAKALNISIDTVYRELKLIGRRYRDEILKIDPLTLVADSLQWFDEMERVALFEVASAGKKKTKVVDQASGEVIEIDIVDPNKSKFYIGALRAREMKLKLMLETGIIPREREKMFQALEGLQNEGDIFMEDAERSPEEIQESIQKLLQNGRLMKDGRTSTKRSRTVGLIADGTTPEDKGKTS